MKRVVLFLVLTLLLTLGFAVQGQNIAPYFVVADLDVGFPADFEAQVAAAGGTITKTFPQIGVAVVETANPNFASQIGGVAGIGGIGLAISPETQNVALDSYGNPPNSGDDDFYFDLQWGHDAVNAPEAWNAGVRGAGVRVFVLDTGFDMDHPDLAPNLNYDLSTSFVPGETVDYIEEYPGDPFSHGTHTMGTIGAADNGFGTIGIAPESELVAVKVLSDTLGYGLTSWIVEGILYAADNDADVISMSLGFLYVQGEGPGSNINAMDRVVTGRAIAYAYQHGATVVVAAGNDATDLNDPWSKRAYYDYLEETYGITLHSQGVSVLNSVSSAPQSISVSATAPIGWAIDPENADFDLLASYSNIGPEIDFSAPGGTVDGYYDFGPEVCQVGPVVHYCYVFDLVFSTGNGGWYWAAGTSMATPHVAGLAALIISENGGDMKPAQVERELRRRAEKFSGQSDIHGFGAARSGY